MIATPGTNGSGRAGGGFGGPRPLLQRRLSETTSQMPALGAAGTGANGVAQVGAPGGALPDAPLELNDARPMTTGGALPIGDAPTAGPFAAGPDSRGAGSPFLAPMPPSPTPNPMPNPSGGFPLASYGSPGGPGGQGGYAQTQGFGPGQDLRGTAILPGDSAATQGANGAVATAMQNYAGFQGTPFQGVAPGSYAPGGDTTALRGSLAQALQALQSAPDRGQLASQNFNLLDQTAREASARDQRTIGQSAAKFGRIGSGVTTTNLGDLGERQAIDRSRAQSQMSLDAAGQTMADRLATAGAIQSGFGALSGADLSTAGVQAGLRGEARTERDAANTQSNQDFSRKGQVFGDLAAYASGQSATDAARRAELRGERGYQGGQEQTAYDRSQQAIQTAGQQSNQQLAQALAALSAGSGGSPAYLAALTGAGNTATQNGAMSQQALYALMAALGQRSGG